MISLHRRRVFKVSNQLIWLFHIWNSEWKRTKRDPTENRCVESVYILPLQRTTLIWMISLFPRRSILSSCSNWSQKIASQCLLVSFLFFLLFCSLWFNSKIELFVFRVVSRFVRRLVYRIRLKMWILFAALSLSLCVCFCDRFRFGLWQLWTVCRPITSFFLLNLSISVGCHTQLQHKFTSTQMKWVRTFVQN